MTARRLAVVTGAASGIGNATVRRLAQQGWTVGALDLDRRTVRAATADLGHAVIPLAADVSDFRTVRWELERFMHQASATRLDLLVNSAGLLYMGHFEEQAATGIELVLAVNNAGVAHCCQAAFPWLRSCAQAGGRPAVVNLSSASSVAGIPSMAVYSASKFWVRGFTEALSVEWSRFGIAVRDVMPPFVRTPMLDGRQQNRFIALLGVTLTADDVAREVLKAAEGGPLHRLVTFNFKAACALVRVTPGRWVRALLAVIGGYATGPG
ncbi:SDR family NAD(P)-dependent oxidoreductase [Rugamonas apoptosis]|uniref:SDR family NAD(P)-dependent oxidoreductase n=1 Tax=Rugamonas apoptosis TaxID=2758570 RepID=A0A7W2FAN6_9BURK|nr:SDR family NAD(P)-dependent oxidoreductase [Rugamonas apoptosis]MBA5688258.1 SDR family NAD(P)-dependent oxidoreductase [Rugamonas apoptosis]